MPVRKGHAHILMSGRLQYDVPVAHALHEESLQSRLVLDLSMLMRVCMHARSWAARALGSH